MTEYLVTYLADFLGHVIPGCLFAFMGFWWSLGLSKYYVQLISSQSPLPEQADNSSDAHTYKSTLTMPCSCQPSSISKLQKDKHPIENLIVFFLMAALVVVFIIAFVINININFPGTKITITALIYLNPDNIQHMTMLLPFALTALIQIAIHYGVKLPDDIEYAALALSYFIEGFLFTFHLHGHSSVDVQTHILLIIAIGGCVLFTLLEMGDRCQILYKYGRILFTCLQGTWFVHIAFILNPPSSSKSFEWIPEAQGNLVALASLFSWHILLISVFLLVELFTFKILIGKRAFGRYEYTQLARTNESLSRLESLSSPLLFEDDE